MRWSSRGKRRGCPSKTCRAGDPAILNLNEAEVPSDVQERLFARGLSVYGLKKCAYCGAVWVIAPGHEENIVKALE